MGTDAGTLATDQVPSLWSDRWVAEVAAVPEIRAAVVAFARRHGAAPELRRDIALAVTEAATNAVLHAFVDRSPGTVSLRAHADGGGFVVTVSDDGDGMRPRPDSPGLGVGLALIGRLASAVDIRGREGGGTVLRMTFGPLPETL